MKQSLRFAILLFLGLGLAPAQTAVVKKIVNLRADPSVRQSPLKKLRPPAQLELLDARPTAGFFHVRTASGEDGWVWARNIRFEPAEAATPTSDIVHAHSHKKGLGDGDEEPHLYFKKAGKKARHQWSGTAGSEGSTKTARESGSGPMPTPTPRVYRVEAAPPPPISFPSFPWPPPAASASEAIPNDLLVAESALHSLGDVNARLVRALDLNGYAEKKYYAVPDGFAVATRLEQIEADGRPKPEPDRWSADSPEFRSLGAYLHALFSANPGYYRVIVFIVTDVPFTEASRKVSETEAAGWLEGGLNQLPQEIADMLCHNGVVSTALIYEFHKDQGRDPQLNEPSRLGAREHLVHSGIWKALGGAL